MSDAVLDLLNKEKLAFTVSGRDYLIHCLNPEHADSHPSFRVDKLSGVAHCFSCGFKTNLFKYYGVFSNPVPIQIAKLKEKIQKLKIGSSGLALPNGATQFTRPYRGISSKTLKQFGAFYTNMVESLQDRICFPITDIEGKTQVYVGRHTLSNGNPKYLYYPAGVSLPVFPASAPTGHSTIVLVEGIFDMLNLYDKGLHNVVCTFGTNTLQHNTREKLSAFKIQGITKIYLLFDGDTAGNDAAAKLAPLIEECGFVTQILPLDNDIDPGQLSQEHVNDINTYINDRTSK